MGERFKETGHSISSSKLANGAYRFIATSMDGEAIPGTAGTLFTVTLKADASLASGTKLSGIVKNIEFNTQDNQKLTFKDVSFVINVVKTIVKRGDANGDGKVDIVDVTMTISQILGQNPVGFNQTAADVNNDGKIDIVDVTSIIDIILGK